MGSDRIVMASPALDEHLSLVERREPAETAVIRSNESDRTRAAAFSHNQDPNRTFMTDAANGGTEPIVIDAEGRKFWQ